MQQKIEKLSSKLYILSTPHRFKKEQNSFDKGYLNVNEWMDKLCCEYIEKDREIISDFESMIEKLKVWVETRGDSAYKEGMKKALKDAGYMS